MEFAEKLRTLRTAAGLSQAELAGAAGVTVRTVQNYETGARLPHNIRIAGALATALGTTTEALLGTAELLTIDAYARGGRKAEKDVSALVGEVTALFSGGALPDEDMDAVMEALNRAYFDAKRRNQKYAKKTGKKGSAL